MQLSIRKAACYLGVAACAFYACTERDQQDKWISLIGDTPGEHWHTYLKDSVAGWKLTDGVLSTSGKNGDLVTNGTFANFELEAEWKINEGGNSGIFYYVVEDPKYPRMHETGPEFQLIDDDGYHQELTPAQKTGSLSDVIAPNVAAANPPGSWNQTKIVVNNGHAEHWLNGQLILTYELGSPEWKEQVAASKFAELDYGKTRSGRIGIQDHGDSVYYRNIRIKAL